MAEPLELEPEDGSIFIEYELWDYEWTREKSGFWRSRESGHERLQKLAYRGWVRIPPGDYEAMLDALSTNG